MDKYNINEKADKYVEKHWDMIVQNLTAKHVKESIVSEIDGLVEELFADNKLGPTDFANWYQMPCMWDYETQEDYDQAVEQAELDQVANQVCRWYSVTKKGFGLFRTCGDPVAKYKGIYIWGRTTNGESIVEDFTNDKRKMDLMSKILKTDKK